MPSDAEELIAEENFERKHEEALIRVYEQWAWLLDVKTISAHQLDAIILHAYRAWYEEWSLSV